mmetsp:Transcript_126025/g.368238  ORF Transcript_126025/g.368238 Transcript_126025/m.368238 type:complete len:574 (-) Transcript_126025:285-2006(-)
MMVTARAPDRARVVQEERPGGEAPAARRGEVVAELVAEGGLAQAPRAPEAQDPPQLEGPGEGQLQRLAAHEVLHARPEGPVRPGLRRHGRRRGPPHLARGAAARQRRLAQEHEVVGHAADQGVGAAPHGGPRDLVAREERPARAQGLVERRAEEVRGPVQELDGAADRPPEAAEAGELAGEGLGAAGEEDQEVHAVPGPRGHEVGRRHRVGGAVRVLEDQELRPAHRDAVRGDLDDAGARPCKEDLAEVLHCRNADFCTDALGRAQCPQVGADVEWPHLLTGHKRRGVQKANQDLGRCGGPLRGCLVRDLARRLIRGRRLQVLLDHLLDQVLLLGDDDLGVVLLRQVLVGVAAYGLKAGVVDAARRGAGLRRLLLPLAPVPDGVEDELRGLGALRVPAELAVLQRPLRRLLGLAQLLEPSVGPRLRDGHGRRPPGVLHVGVEAPGLRRRIERRVVVVLREADLAVHVDRRGQVQARPGRGVLVGLVHELLQERRCHVRRLLRHLAVQLALSGELLLFQSAGLLQQCQVQLSERRQCQGLWPQRRSSRLPIGNHLIGHFHCLLQRTCGQQCTSC